LGTIVGAYLVIRRSSALNWVGQRRPWLPGAFYVGAGNRAIYPKHGRRQRAWLQTTTDQLEDNELESAKK
jgi:hypothetical protein